MWQAINGKTPLVSCDKSIINNRSPNPMLIKKCADESISEIAVELNSGWWMVGVSPGSFSSPAELESASLDWIQAFVPGTVAHSLELSGKWTIDSKVDFDEQDWWYRCSFPSNSRDSNQYILRFGGLATIADIWLNGSLILSSENMFLEQSVDVSSLLADDNELVICFKSLTNALSDKRPRPKWKTNLVSHQQLRWYRTTLLGRIPGWTPPVASVGPWRSIFLDRVPKIAVDDINLSTTLEGSDGIVEFSCRVNKLPEYQSISAILSVSDHHASLAIDHSEDGQTYLRGNIRIENVSAWWPHTHGEPQLYSCAVTVQTSVDEIVIDCGDIGFRSVKLLNCESEFELSINGQYIFCRGACWTVGDIVSLSSNREVLMHYLSLAVEAGMNMVRIGGTMLYESDLFYDLCDKLGIMVWQDFMFANMDYPVEDSRFLSSVQLEVTQQLKRLQTHPSVAIYCGNSEVEQQAAMLGMPRDIWRNDLFSKILPELCECWHIGAPYIASTPSGGYMPFHVGAGVTHYYGVGAYLRPVSDAKTAGVRFTSECLGFSNVPEQSTVNKAMGGLAAVTHHPRWKSRVPRDTGASWDFETIRDHYLGREFGVDVENLKYCDLPRYFDLSRVVTGEVMSQVFQEWRQNRECQGGLVWFYKDIWPGAGWGIIDSEGIPKACYYYLKRVWAPQAILLTDEGLDGLNIHVVNDKQETIEGFVEIQLFDDGYNVSASATKEVVVGPGSSLTFSADEMLETFFDVTYAYRFGPKKHDVVVAAIHNNEGDVIAESTYYPQSKELVQIQSPTVKATARLVGNDYRLELESDAFMQAVQLEILGYISDDNYFSLTPGRKKIVQLRPHTGYKKKPKCYISALNVKHSIKLALS
jgi:beta-mannosidase